MGTMRLMRRLTGGTPCVLLATVLLFARLLAPSIAMAQPSTDLALQAICHSPAPDQPPGRGGPSDHRDCLLCPACHLVSQAALPVHAAPELPRPTVIATGLVTPWPSPTGPPSRVRTAAQPTGPPHPSV